MEVTSAVSQPEPPQAQILQMVMGGWVAKVIAEATRLGVPDIVKKQGPLTAAEMVAGGTDTGWGHLHPPS